MLEKWQFNVLFFVGVGGAILLLIGPKIGLDIGPNGYMGVGAILTFILTQKRRENKGPKKSTEEEAENNGSQ